MKLSYVSPRYFPAISGAEFYFQRTAEILNKKGHKVGVSCTNAIDFAGLRKPNKRSLPSMSGEVLKGVEINRFPVEPWNPDGKKIIIQKLRKISCSKQATKLLLENGPISPALFNHMDNLGSTDVVHTTYLPYSTILAGLLPDNPKIPRVCTPFYHFGNPRYRRNEYIEILEKYDLILCCSGSEKDYLRGLGIPENKLKLISMGVDLEKFAKATSKTFQERFNLQDAPMILFCGYKNYEKGAITLLECIPSVTKKIPDVVFTFIGPSTTAFNYRLKSIKKEGFRNIINLDPSNLSGYFDKTKLSAFRCCDLYAMPSRSDAFGISFLEAWACKKPVLGTCSGATPDIIFNKEDGILVPFGEIKETSAAIVRLLENKALRSRLGENGYLKILDYGYTWEKVSERLLKYYEALV